MATHNRFRILIGYILIVGLLLLCCFKLFPYIGFWWTILLVILTPVAGEFGSKWLIRLFEGKRHKQDEDEEDEMNETSASDEASKS